MNNKETTPQENTYANTGPNSLHNPVTPDIPSQQPPPPPPKTKGTKPVTMSSSDTDTDAGASAGHTVVSDSSMGQSTQYSHSSLPRPTSRPLVSTHMPHYQSQSLPRRSVNNQSSTSNVRSFVKSPATIATPFEEEYLCQLPIEDLVARIKILEGRNRKLVLDNGTMMKNLNQHIATMQTLKYQNFRLASDNNELRDLTVYLDDERNRARSLAKQWQDFGNHMSRVMKHEIANYARKLHVLEDKQFELVRENFELRQLCVLMDKAMNANRTGTGAANSGSNNNNDNNSRGSNASSQDHPSSSSSSSDNMINTRARDQVRISQEILEYIKGLEERIHHLEWEKKQHQTIPMNTCQDDVNSNSVTNSDRISLDQGIGGSSTYESGRVNILGSPPATLLEAMRNLRLSSTSTPSTIKDQGNNSSNNTIVTTTPSSVNSSLRSRSVSPRKSSTRI